jgi:hypothetical protein
MKSLPIKSDRISDKPEHVVLDAQGGIFSIHVAIQDARYNARIIGGHARRIDWKSQERAIWEASLYGQ